MSACERLGVGQQQIVKTARLFFSIGVSRVPGNPNLNRNVRLEGNDDLPAQPRNQAVPVGRLGVSPMWQTSQSFRTNVSRIADTFTGMLVTSFEGHSEDNKCSI